MCCEDLQRVCCQTHEDVFLICWCFFYLHVFSEVAAHWALSATVMTRSERAPWAQWWLTGQRSLFYWYTAEQHIIVLPKLIWLVPGAEAKLKHASEKSRVMWMQKKTQVSCLNKGFLKKKGTKTAVLRRMAKGVAKLRSVVCSAPGSAPWPRPWLQGHKSAFTFTHLAGAFIQSDLQLHSGYKFSLVCVFPGNRTHNLLRCWRDALPLSHTGTHDSILWAAEDALIKAGAPPSILLKNTHTAGL